MSPQLVWRAYREAAALSRYGLVQAAQSAGEGDLEMATAHLNVASKYARILKRAAPRLDKHFGVTR